MFKEALKDERWPMIFGVLTGIFAVFLLVAFVGYLFTWQEDQSLVLSLRWSDTTSDTVANPLGRVGAYLSHFHFYYLFGLPSFILVGLLFIFSKNLLFRLPRPILRTSYIIPLLVMLWLSVVLAFIFEGSPFPWGGGIGGGIASWLAGLIGHFGVILMIISTFILIFVWVFNPDVPDLVQKSFWGKVGEKTDLTFRQAILSIFNFTKRPEKAVIAKPAAPKALEVPPQPNPEIIQPKTQIQADDPVPHAADPQPAGKQSKIDFDEVNLPKKPELTTDSGLEIEVPKGDEQSTSLSIQQENKDGLDPYDPTLDLSSYENPVVALLDDYADVNFEVDRAELEANKEQIVTTLQNYKIDVTKIKATIGPTVTLYEIVPAPGVRISRIRSLEDDIALSLAALGIRIIAPIPGKGTIGIEVPNRKTQIVSLKEVLISEKFKRVKMDLPIALGKTIQNEVFVVDLARMPHLLIAGATGQGKSVGINTILMSLLYKKHPSQIKLVLIDPKKVELSLYSMLEKHFLAFLPDEEEPIVTETAKVVQTLMSLCVEMDQRYDLLKKAKVRHIREYNNKFVKRSLNPEKGHRFLPYIVLVIDEFADLIMTAGKEVELPIGRLAQLARAVGIHLIIATQRPSVNIITGVIKANFPARLAFKVTSKIDSRTILDTGGAEQLIGRGDMLLSTDGNVVRLQCAFIDTHEVENVITFISDQQGYADPFLLPEYGTAEGPGGGGFKIDEVDSLFWDAAGLVVNDGRGSTSMIQRKLSLGYNRAGRIMDQMEAAGIVGASEGSKPREVLVTDHMELAKLKAAWLNR